MFEILRQHSLNNITFAERSVQLCAREYSFPFINVPFLITSIRLTLKKYTVIVVLPSHLFSFVFYLLFIRGEIKQPTNIVT